MTFDQDTWNVNFIRILKASGLEAVIEHHISLIDWLFFYSHRSKPA